MKTRLAYLMGEVTALRDLLTTTPDRAQLLQDAWKRRGTRYALQTSVEAIADVAYHICAKAYHKAPGDPHEAVDKLVQEGVLSAGTAKRLHGLIGLRNRLVHGYLDIDDQRLLELLAAGLGDLEAYAHEVTRYLEQASSDRPSDPHEDPPEP
ncbi:type VII toxin-antitoxin system HepT family RNase toxin [Limnochorda pilosa]|nr:DUF86 domain-containing protein [Limnochorda pilosa]